MKCLVVLVSLICGTFCENPHNSLTDVIAMVITDTDINPQDGVISEAEFRQELLGKWDSDIPTDNRVSEHDFVQQWTARYGDNHKDATTFFRNIDNFPDGELTEVDLLFHLGTLDPDGDGQVSTTDFGNFIRTNHPCGQHGHLGC